MRVLLLLCLGLFAGHSQAETLPPRPAHYFNDYAGVVPTAQSRALDEKLVQFERDSSNQVVVAVFPKMDSESSVQDYTFRVAQSWKVGQAGRNNGAVLFVFVQDHQMYLQVGYGLEGALPDITAKRIIRNEITPRFKSGDLAGGLSAGVDAILAATRGEYKGTGRTHSSGEGSPLESLLWLVFLVVVILIIKSVLGNQSRVYRRSGWNSTYWSTGGISSGGGSSDSGSSFSGGGGDFGGGGAGGSW